MQQKDENLLILNKAAKIYDAGKIEAGNTIYLTVADKYGNMVSLIQSNYRGWVQECVLPDLDLFFRTEVKCSVLRRP